MDESRETLQNGWEHHWRIDTTASPQAAWEAWVVPERITGWFADEAYGEARPGGELVLVFTSFGLELAHRVLTVEPGRRLVLEGRGPGGDRFRQEVRLESAGGRTVIHLTHSEPGGHGEADVAAIDSGWQLALALLGHYLEQHFGRPRTSFLVMRPTALSPETVQPYFRSPEGLACWLTRAGSLAARAPGEKVALDLLSGGTLSGHLLADSGRELALSWEEIGGVLELKVFPAGPGEWILALRGSSWSLDEARMQTVAGRMEEALERLVAETVSSGPGT